MDQKTEAQKLADFIETIANQTLAINRESPIHSQTSGILLTLSYAIEQDQLQNLITFIQPFLDKEAEKQKQ